MALLKAIVRVELVDVGALEPVAQDGREVRREILELQTSQLVAMLRRVGRRLDVVLKNVEKTLF